MQGSTLSTMLCSIFLGHLERTQLLPLLSSKQTTHSTNGSLAASGPGLTELAQAAGERNHADTISSDISCQLIASHEMVVKCCLAGRKACQFCMQGMQDATTSNWHLSDACLDSTYRSN